MSDVERLDAALMRVARSVGIEKPGATSAIFVRWAEVVGDELATRTQPVSLKSGVLRIRVGSGAWATEVRYLADKIAAAANGMVGSEIVSEVEVSVGKLAEQKRDDERDADARQTNVCLPSKPKPSAQAVAESEEVVAEIADDQVRESLKKAHLAAKMRRDRA